MSEPLNPLERKLINQEESNLVIPTEAVSLETNKINELKKKIADDTKLQREIASDNREIRTKVSHWREYSDREWGKRKRVPLVDFLKTTDFVERNRIHEKRVWNKKWMESVRWSTDAERQFATTAEQIVEGQFVEVLQVSLFKDQRLVFKGATVGSGLDVSKKSIDDVVQSTDFVSAVPDVVYIVHNHADEYADLKTPTEKYDGNDGLVTVGGLSKRDIEFADELWQEQFGRKAKVFIMAINRRGLTFMYEAGTSQLRDWQNDVRQSSN